MELANKVAAIAKRTLPVSGVFDELIRAIGESKSKSEEDAIVGKLVELSKAKIKEGRREPRTQKELLVYLIYIEMLGHDTSWAQATAIQLCSDKNLAVKKLAYLTVSLLLDPASELSIMVVATIQADLRSDNFLTVCTALSAICHIVTPELVGVFLPQVTALLRHDRDLVKKKALLAMQRFLQVDPSVAPDVERHLIDKIGYKEPSVMVASLCGLRELIRRDPAPYRNLVHYFTNILKQAAEGKLGRAYEYHRAPAPFVQLELLRLLASLGAGDKSASENMYAVIAEVKRRAEPLGNNIGNALVYECVKAVAAIHPSPVLIAGAMESVARFLASRENNLRYAGIDALTRMVHIDPKHAQDHQLAVVDCLRSPDVTLKRKTLQLLYKMAGPANIEVIAGEVLHYLREAAPGDEVARADAVCSLCDLAERFAPDHAWFVDTMNELFEVAGEVVPPSLADNLTRLIAEGTGEEDEGADRELRAGAVESYLELLDKPKLPRVLLKVICWVVGEYGRLAGRSQESVMDALAAIPETQAGDDEVKGWVVSALGKLAAQVGQPLTADAAALVEAATSAEAVELQQRALEVQALLRAPAATQRAALPYDAAAEDVGVDPDLPFLDAFVQQSLQNGAAPYLSLEDRLAMGMTREGGLGLHPAPHVSALKFQAYAAAPPPQPRPAAPAPPAPVPAAAAAGAAAVGDLDFGGLSLSQPATAPAATAVPPAAAAAAMPAVGAGEPQLRLSKPGRKWGGPVAAEAPRPAAAPAAAAAAPAPQQYAASPAAAAGPSSATSAAAAAPVVDVEKQRLAASLFGGGGGSGPSASPGLRGRRAAGSPAKPSAVARPAAAAPDLLGGMDGEHAAAAPPAAAAGPSNMDLLMGLDAPTAASSSGVPSTTAASPAPPDPMVALVGLGGGMQQASPLPSPAHAAASGGSSSLLDFGDLAGNSGVLAPAQAPPRAQQALAFDDLLGGAALQPQLSPARPQAAAVPLGSLGLGGTPVGGASQGGQKLPPPAKKDPFADLLGMSSDEAASVAVAVLFGLACIACVISKKIGGFKLYLLLGLSSAFRCIGFAARAAQLNDPTNTDLAAVSLVFRQAGYGISIAVLCILSGCYLKNARDEMKPRHSFPYWSVGVRLLIAPVIVFGPIMGIAISVLVYAVSSPESLHTAEKLRKGSSWTFMGIVSILHILANIAAVYVLRWQHATANADAAPQQARGTSFKLQRSGSLRRMNTTMRLAVRHDHSWVHMLQVLCLLLQLSTIFRVVSLYHPEYSTNPKLFYPLQVLPELLYILLLLLPTVMIRVAMLDRYHAFVAAVKAGQPYVPAAAASHAKGSSECTSMRGSKQAATDIEANGQQ